MKLHAAAWAMELANHLSGLRVKGADLESVAVYILAVGAARIHLEGNPGRLCACPLHVVVQPLSLGTSSAESRNSPAPLRTLRRGPRAPVGKVRW